MAIVINSTTGEIDLDQTTPGTYVVTYTVQGVSSTQEVTVNAADNAAFSYSASSYLPTDPDPTPTITGLTGGTFSAGSGLVFVDSGTNTGSSTGQIDLSASTATSYTITYNTSSSGSSVCPNTSTQTVEIEVPVDQIANAEAMSFNGTDQYIDVGTTLNSMLEIGDSFSISAWVNFGNTSTDRTIISNFTSSIKGIQLRVLNNESIRIIIAESSSKYLFVDSTSLATNTWHHIVATYDGSNTIGGLKLYINSILDNNTNGTQGTITTITSTDSLKIGAYTSGQYFDGKLDEVAIFNTELSASKIQEIYNATAVVNGVSQTANLFTGGLDSSLVYWNRMGDS